MISFFANIISLKIQKQTEIRQNLHKTLYVEKAARKMLVKFTSGFHECYEKKQAMISKEKSLVSCVILEVPGNRYYGGARYFVFFKLKSSLN